MSHEKFEVGEIVEIVTSADPEWPPGRHVKILGPLEMSWGFPSHQIGWQGSSRVMSWAHCLRKLPPKQDWVKLCNLNDVPREVPEHV